MAAATAASRFSIQLSRTPIKPPQKPQPAFRKKKYCERWSSGLNSNYGTWGWARQLRGSGISALLQLQLDHMLFVVNTHGTELIQDVLAQQTVELDSKPP